MSTFEPPFMFPQLSARRRLRARGNGAAAGELRELALAPGEQAAGCGSHCTGTRSAAIRGQASPASRPVKQAENHGADDRDLMARISNADAAAMKTLFARHQLRVFRFIERILRNPAIAEEVTNEVFLEVWRGARNFQGRSSASTWILAIAHNRSLNVLRKRRELCWNEDHAAQIPDLQDDPEVASQKAGKSALLRKCADALAPLHREIIDLVYYHEMSIREASNVLNVPEGTVKARLFNARKKLQALLTAAGVDRGWP
ncbi:sigma-70 family RNA polymerase sigma factor [Anderseniella sp. Alg231-50]|uniref:sigma-70 family RNA polymerase sigma factor n=1 Tax=Anderseniella sp. Alg231-50 TaxID=1922226 RepID=UPI00307B36D5